MSHARTLVVVGAGLAGAKAAEGARAHGFDGRILLVGEETRHPYERPSLSKQGLRGEESVPTYVHDEAFYAEHAIELLTWKRVASLDVAARRIQLDSCAPVPFDTAVLATGAAPRTLNVPGSDLQGVHYLRTAEDAVALGAAIRGAGRVAIIGAGWIGTEVAASARQMGASVVLIDPLEVPLQRVLGRRVGEVFAQLHADHGVELRLGRAVTGLSGQDRVSAVGLGDGSIEPADVVVVGIGALPRVDLAREAGLAVAGGVVVDQYLETSAAGIYAAGDIAEALHPVLGRRLRVEHWANARNQGLTAGGNAAGAREAYTRLPYFFSDQFDLGMEYVGHGSPDDEVVIRGDISARKFIAFWLRAGRVTAAMNVNVWDVVEDLKALVASQRQVAPEHLADAALGLGSLVS
ncbi:MAG TPA: FAD-dependent oxidoreductase [Sporichthya sp.]|nr:FAD-dependent oxidoreductase [Sporichthya sp.]